MACGKALPRQVEPVYGGALPTLNHICKWRDRAVIIEPQCAERACTCRETHGGQNSDVRANDLAFSLHCNLMSTLMLLQMMRYKGGGQRVTAVCWSSTAGGPRLCHLHAFSAARLSCAPHHQVHAASLWNRRTGCTAAPRFGTMLAASAICSTAGSTCRLTAPPCHCSQAC